ncbi:hypothetical protein ACI3EY_08000 [Ornithinimicrobium sp. LYQ92]|uniref:phage major capsid protein n=1 Tax=Serinicoccus sp. LYQ92 TaxID=3378798 RepID=UPI0038519231
MPSTIARLAESLGVDDQRLAGVMPRRMSEADVADTARLLHLAWNGDERGKLAVNEALTTSDLFRSATGEVLAVAILAAYEEMPTQWTKTHARTTLPDFRPKKLRDLAGARTALPKVPEHTNYPEALYAIRESEISVGKFGEQFGYSFEARVNDQLGELRLVPQSWAGKARRTEDLESLRTLADPLTGAPNTAFFNGGNGNLGTGALTQENLQTAVTGVRTKRDTDGNLLYPGQLQLVVGPALQFTAQRILNTQEIRTTEGGVTVIETNPFRDLTLTVRDDLPGSAWFILPVPSSPRPAFYQGFLIGHETPDTRYRADQGNSQGGSPLGADAGSFDDDTIYWRTRHITGAAPGDPVFAYASDGS